MIEEALPLDEIRRTEWRVWLAFWGQAASVPALGAEQRSRYREWTDVLSRLLDDAGIETPVSALVAVIDGIGVRATIAPDDLPPTEQLALVKNVLDATSNQPVS